MTPREKKLVAAGLVLGLAVALGAYGAAHMWHPESTAARADERAMPAYEAPAENAGGQPDEHKHPKAESQPLSSVRFSEEEQAQIGVQTVEVARRKLQRILTTVARVDQPETQLASISARVSGRIDKLYADFTGQPVRRGQAIALIYSPEVLSTAEEYRLALENRKRLGTKAEPQAIAGAADLVDASRRRLELWGLTPKQLDEIASSDKPEIDLPIYSPASGIITERRVTQGQYVNAGEVLYTVTDLSTVWIRADLYEPDLPLVRTGQPVEITSDALPGAKLHGKVGFVDTSINPQTRTASARIQVANPGMRLRPGMFVQAQFAAPVAGDVVAVPRSAVLDTGTQKIVYVAKGNGEFEGRAVKLGQPAGDFYPVLAGLREGERVVSQGNFLIDSQTRITGGMTGLYGGSTEFDRGAAQAAAAPDLKFTFRSDPATPRGNSPATLYVTLADSSGTPIKDAQVTVALTMPPMPAMGMAGMQAVADLVWKGSEYAGTVKVPTAGSWNVEINARRNGQFLGSFHTRMSAQ
jgi:RND family efflux transporter MFP subunit